MTVLKHTISVFCLLIFSISAYSADKAPDFAVGKTKSGKKINLSSYRGRVVYLDFWASWCIPCKDSFPWMNEMQARYKKNGLVIVAVNLDDDAKQAKRFLDKNPAKFTISYNQDGTVASKYGVEVMPSSYLIDKKGNIVYKKLGFKHKDKDKMEAALKKALAQK